MSGPTSDPAIGQAHLFEPPKPTHLTLADRFLVPPFSVLDARAGYWQARKRDWLLLGIQPEVGAGREVAYLATEGMLGGTGREATPGSTPAAHGGGHGSMNDKLLGASGRREGLLYSDDPHPLGAGGAREAAAYKRKQAQQQAYEEAAGRTAEPVPGQHAGYALGAAGRGDRLLSKATPREGYGGDYDLSKGENAWGGAGTSIFDPVICEIAYRWFTPHGGLVYDPFAGGSVRGIVAAMLGRRYLGVDLRPEQVAANEQQAATIGAARPFAHQPQWLVGDARDTPLHLGGRRPDMVFTCPPYYDLERYSDDPRDLSNAGSYAAFLAGYQQIVEHAVRALAPNRFACFVVGEVRAPDGAYHGLVPDTIVAFEEAGARYYNEAILATSVGSLPIRTSRTFGPGRKLGKSHQNVLVFVKGDGRLAAEACGMVPEVALEYGGAVWRADGTLTVPETGEQASFVGEEP